MNALTPSVQEALDAACQVRLQAHAPYSHFQVGAALRATDGRLFLGCNVENRSYGLTLCAERAAVCAAVAARATKFESLALALPNAQPPCGACLQVLAEFCSELPIWVADPDTIQSAQLLYLKELLPHQFRL